MDVTPSLPLRNPQSPRTCRETRVRTPCDASCAEGCRGGSVGTGERASCASRARVDVKEQQNGFDLILSRYRKAKAGAGQGELSCPEFRSLLWVALFISFFRAGVHTGSEVHQVPRRQAWPTHPLYPLSSCKDQDVSGTQCGPDGGSSLLLSMSQVGDRDLPSPAYLLLWERAIPVEEEHPGCFFPSRCVSASWEKNLPLVAKFILT